MVLNWQSLISLAFAAALCGCASNTSTNTSSVVPENVPPVKVDPKAYMAFTCKKLEDNLSYIAQELEDATHKPDDKTKGNIAHLNGETEAVKTAMLLKRCGQPADAKKPQ
jgi:hypothetical protein